MIKGALVITACCIGALAFSGPKLKQSYDILQTDKKMEQTIADTSTKITNLEAELAKVKKQCADMQVDSNIDTAKTISQFKGAKIQTITSLITKDGSEFECSEVTEPADVIYFNHEIEKIRYTLKISDAKAFVDSLNRSAVAFETLNISTSSKVATLTVTSVSTTLNSEPIDE